MAAVAQFTNDPVSAAVSISTANTNRDGSTGTYGTAYTFRAAGATTGGKGGRIDFITIVGTGASTTAGMVRMFIGSTMVREIAVSALTPSATVKGYTIPTSEGADSNGRLPLGIVCAPGDVVKFSTHNAEAFIVRVEGGEF